MKFSTESFGEVEFKETGDGSYEAEVPVGEETIDVSLAWAGEESTALNSALDALLMRLGTLLESGRAALAANMAETAPAYGVAYYAEMHEEELSVLAEVSGSNNSAIDECYSQLRLCSVSVDPKNDETRYTLDYVLGGRQFDLTDQILCVRLNAEGDGSEVSIES